MLFKRFQVIEQLNNDIMLIFWVAIGFNVETVIYKNLKFQVWDLGGQTGIRFFWFFFIRKWML